MDKSLHGVEGDHVAGVRCLQILRFAQYLPAVLLEYLALAVRALRDGTESSFVLDDTADRDWLGAGQLERCAELKQQGVQLLLSEVRIHLPQSCDLANDPPVVPALSSLLRGAGAAIQALEFPLACLELLLPVLLSVPRSRVSPFSR